VLLTVVTAVLLAGSGLLARRAATDITV